MCDGGDGGDGGDATNAVMVDDLARNTKQSLKTKPVDKNYKRKISYKN